MVNMYKNYLFKLVRTQNQGLFPHVFFNDILVRKKLNCFVMIKILKGLVAKFWCSARLGRRGGGTRCWILRGKIFKYIFHASVWKTTPAKSALSHMKSTCVNRNYEYSKVGSRCQALHFRLMVFICWLYVCASLQAWLYTRIWLRIP